MSHRKKKGFTLVEVMIAVAVIGLLAAIAIPSFKAARHKSLNKVKQSNVRLLNNAVELWAMDHLAGDQTPIGVDIASYIRGGLGGLDVGDHYVSITNITTKTVDYTFTIADLY